MRCPRTAGADVQVHGHDRVDVVTPPRRRSRLAGTYCGFSPAGKASAWTSPTAGGRSERPGRRDRSLRDGLTFGSPTTNAVAPDRLAFRASYTQPLLDGSARAFLSGRFDQAGAMSGTLTLQQPSFTYEGVQQPAGTAAQASPRGCSGDARHASGLAHGRARRYECCPSSSRRPSSPGRADGEPDDVAHAAGGRRHPHLLRPVDGRGAARSPWRRPRRRGRAVVRRAVVNGA
jgi:hypothetical protein